MKRSGFASRLQIAQVRREEDVRFHTRVYMMDLVTIALGRMGLGEKRFRQLNDTLNSGTIPGGRSTGSHEIHCGVRYP